MLKECSFRPELIAKFSPKQRSLSPMSPSSANRNRFEDLYYVSKNFHHNLINRSKIKDRKEWCEEKLKNMRFLNKNTLLSLKESQRNMINNQKKKTIANSLNMISFTKTIRRELRNLNRKGRSNIKNKLSYVHRNQGEADQKLRKISTDQSNFLILLC